MTTTAHPNPFDPRPFAPETPTVFPLNLDDETLLRETRANGYYGTPLAEELCRRLELALEAVDDQAQDAREAEEAADDERAVLEERVTALEAELAVLRKP